MKKSPYSWDLKLTKCISEPATSGELGFRKIGICAEFFFFFFLLLVIHFIYFLKYSYFKLKGNCGGGFLIMMFCMFCSLVNLFGQLCNIALLPCYL